MFKRRGPCDKIGPEAVSKEDEAFGIDFRTCVCIIDDGAYYGFPIPTKNELLLADGSALTRSVEGKNIVATSQCRGTYRDVGFLLRRISPGCFTPLRFDLPGSVAADPSCRLSDAASMRIRFAFAFWHARLIATGSN